MYAVLPGDVHDPAAPSGGNTYDVRVCRALSAGGWSVREVAVRGSWPRPGTGARRALADALASVPDGATVLLDGLVAAGVPEIVAPAAARLRVVVLVHLPLAEEAGLDPATAADLDQRERRTVRAAAAVVATSAESARALERRHGLPAGSVHVAPPGVDPAPPAAGTDGASALLCVAAVTPRKGHDVLVEALAELADLSWTCVCVGALDRDPAFVDRVRRAATGHRIADRFRLVGPRVGDRLAELYDGADLLVLPSRAETYGMVVTEALARGVPVVATRAAGVTEALGNSPAGRPGALVPPGDAAALAGTLRRWLTAPEWRAAARAAARARRDTLRRWADTAAVLARVL